MGLFTEMVQDVRRLRERNVTSWSGVQQFISGRAGFADSKYQTYAEEGYRKNALVFSCIEELASSASEPEMQARQGNRWIHLDDRTATQAHRLLEVLDRPNAFMDSYEFWRTVILHRSIAGNAYALKVRSASGMVRELWLLRPDRVVIIPDSETFIRRYEYYLGGGEPVRLPVEDVIHWKTPNPLDDFYGMPPLMAIAANVDLDNYSRDFVKAYFERAGVPSALISTKNTLSDELKQELKDRLGRGTSGPGGWHGTIVIDGTETSYTAMTQSLGAQGLVLPDLNEISEARITGVFGVPLSLVNTVSGAGNSSYGNKKSEREGFWNETLKPLYRELVGPLNRDLVPEFAGVQRVAFDLSTVGALQPDTDALWSRVGKALGEGMVGFHEARSLVGLPAAGDEDVFFIPSNYTQTPTPDIGAQPEPPALSSNGTHPEAVGAGRGA